MKNAIISVIVFLCLLISIFFFNNSVLNLCNDIKYKTDEIELILLSNDKQAAYDKSLELLDLLHEKDFITSIYANHQDFDAIRNEAIKLCVYISHDDITEANASLHVIKYSTNIVKSLQEPSLNNIL
ncbi:MAG: DUF4363 family protein [Clostridium butyricum]|nr:DUF4363 family protein [Clostridium butyricum]